MWIWEGYISEKTKGVWMKCAESLKHINPHVLEDLQDWIVIQGFRPKNETDLRRIEKLIETQRIDPSKKRKKEMIDNEAVTEKRREFINTMRPPFVWNFFPEEEVKVDHVTRAYANPLESYKYENPNRVEILISEMDTLAMNLRTHEQVVWNKLVDHCIDIFVRLEQSSKEEEPVSPKKK